MNDDSKLVEEKSQWHIVAKELEGENIKLAYYDNVLLPLLGDLTGKNVLDFGAGPGVLALAVKRLGGNAKVYDINPEMREKAAEKIGQDNVYNSIQDIPTNFFDFVICNLVLCINPEEEVRKMVADIASYINTTGRVYIGFCNPLIFKIEESNLDFRFPTGDAYETNHRYKKIKKEGNYEIIEDHRPIEWYEKVYADAGLKLIAKHFTPEYEFKGNKIQDFVIFELIK